MIVGRSPAILRARALVERFAASHLPILLVGATGTGKELFAEYIHECGRPGRPFIDVNCGALPRDMVESLLFGHRRGAFTGATESLRGHVERADGGTLFLDELASLPLESQVKLLRVLETGAVQALGSAAKRVADFRLVSAVQEGILGEVDAGRFRRDLYGRVAGVVIDLPPLWQRPEDIVPLATHFAARRGQRVEAEAEAVLLNYAWPGNVRELRLVVERAGWLVENGPLPAQALTEAIALGAPGEQAPPRVRSLDAERLVAACEASGWDVKAATKLLGISRATLYRHLKAYHLRSHRLTLRETRGETGETPSRGPRRNSFIDKVPLGPPV